MKLACSGLPATKVRSYVSAVHSIVHDVYPALEDGHLARDVLARARVVDALFGLGAQHEVAPRVAVLHVHVDAVQQRHHLMRI